MSVRNQRTTKIFWCTCNTQFDTKLVPYRQHCIASTQSIIVNLLHNILFYGEFSQDEEDGIKVGIVIAIAIVAAIIFFVVGFLVSRYCRKKRSGSFMVKNVSTTETGTIELKTETLKSENHRYHWWHHPWSSGNGVKVIMDKIVFDAPR